MLQGRHESVFFFFDKDVTRMLQGCCKRVIRVLQGCYKGVTRVLQESYKDGTKVSQGWYTVVHDLCSELSGVPQHVPPCGAIKVLQK
jgi:hypothetical protein